MQRPCLLVLAGLLVSGCLLSVRGDPAAAAENDTSVVATTEATEADFDEHIKENPYVVVMFYAPWCFWSKMLLPEFDIAAANLTVHDPPVKLIKVDCDCGGVRCELCGSDRYNITGYPTLKWFADGSSDSPTPLPLGGSSSADEIVEWVEGQLSNSTNQADQTLAEEPVPFRRTQSDPAPVAESDTSVVAIEATEADFDEHIKESPYVLVMFYAWWCPASQAMLPVFDNVTANLTERDPAVKLIKVECDGNPDLCEKYWIEHVPMLKLFTDGNLTELATYEGEKGVKAIVDWVDGQLNNTTMAAHQADATLAGDESDEAVEGVPLRRTEKDSSHRCQRFHLRRA
ncbi:unnamed protein product [Vitrella brassicaformis CCMP3155]|uniref:Thioredoxin domain-containing protein n=2 Tax=Vitrella brassicaformis TaxID=1169539 RepID=A0A0G4EAQ0_VITBC|nr:unnamed protein product [Vitrella brassicaformis CCMP3155]|eukprot:CEL92726.1 unnamed protein product [Vitrella brassicaformis CCMP3155]